MLPCTDKIRMIDIRTDVLEIQQAEGTTKEGIGVRLDVVVYYYISEPTCNVLRVAHTTDALSTLTKDSLRLVLADMKQRDLCGRSSLGENVQSRMAETAGHWGIAVERVEIKEVVLNSVPEINEREIINRTIAKLQLSCKENNFAHSQTLQELNATLEEMRAMLKHCHDDATQEKQSSPQTTKESSDSKDMLSNELMVKLYETLYMSH